MSLVESGGFIAASDAVTSAVFYSAVSAFNQRDWNTLSGLLDPNVVAFTVHSHGSGQLQVDGVTSVMTYLMNDVSATTSAAHKDDPHLQVSSSTVVVHGGVVSGFACWTDPPPDGPAQVALNFVVNGQGLIQLMEAPETGVSCTSA
jgi:hypothetical protein